MNEELKKIIAEQLGVDEADVTPEISFEALGADSLDAVEITMACEEAFEIDISDDEAEKVVTVADAQRLIESLLASRTN